MKRVRVPTAVLMAVTAIVAVDLALIRAGAVDCRWWDASAGAGNVPAAVVSGVPMITALAVGLVFMIRGVLRRGETGAFLLGFEVFGWAGVFLMVLGFSLFERWVNRYLETCLNPVAAAVGEGGWSAIEGACVSFAVSLPLFVFASFGGWLAFRFGARVVVICRVTARSSPPPPAVTRASGLQ
jgi:hypothetical protein